MRQNQQVPQETKQAKGLSHDEEDMMTRQFSQVFGVLLENNFHRNTLIPNEKVFCLLLVTINCIQTR
jgi:hypothetical protein